MTAPSDPLEDLQNLIKSENLSSKVQIVPLDGIEIDALTYIEEFWHKHGKFPKTIPVPGFNLKKSLDKESFIRGLYNRGVRPPNTVNDANLSNEQLAAILIVVDIHDRRSITAKLKSVGISSQTWQGWLRDKKFKEYLHSLSTKNFEDALHIAQQGLLSSVEKGDVNAIKYWNQLTGREVNQETHNARVLISHLAQVVQTHVKDPATLMAIAKDFERVMKGEKPDPVVMITEQHF